MMSTPKAFDYATLQAMLEDKRLVNIADNTVAMYDNDDNLRITVFYHGNRIAQLMPDKITIYNQGYFTSTTKERLNWLLSPIGYWLFQENGQWYISNDENDDWLKFKEGMTIEY